MGYQFVRVDQADGIVTVRIDDPDAKNAVNHVMNRELAEECQRIDADPTARVLVLTGEGRIFCSGGNIRKMTADGKSLEPPAPTLRDEMYPHEADIRRVVVGLRRMSKPAIAAVNGPAVGSGIGLAAGCDIRIASRAARFAWVFVRRGIVPDDASLALMAQLIGYARAFEWGVRGATLSAEEAERIGFVSEVVEPDRLLPRCREIAKEIIDHGPPITVQLFKLALAEALEQDLDTAVRFTAGAQKLSRATADHTEALRAYVEKRPPRWTGR
ncbi:MAG: enoyl-CoA hydratase/isomerase family protein [Candidatus Rokubacteria bacterium]|nr:enoyl-CoA hydratase/isomerase family protein [Candidatus Rokubacteria bacterium]